MLDTARRWTSDDPTDPLSAVIAELSDLDQIVAATQRGRRDADRILLRLIDVARADQLAGRVVLQRLLPPVVGRARAFLRSDPEAIESAIASAWISIASYDTQRRPHHVAPALVSDTIDRAFRGPARRRSSLEVSVTDVLFDRRSAPAAADAFCALAAAVGEARRLGVATEHLQLVGELAWVDSTNELAAARGVTARTIRNHRARAIDAIRDAVAPVVSAA